MQYNWIDWIIISIVIYQIIDGWKKGLMAILTSTGAFFASLWIAVRYHGPVGKFFVEKFGLPLIWENAVGYLVLAMPSETVINALLEYPMGRLPRRMVKSFINRCFGSLFAAINALLFLAFLLLLILAFPVRGTVKRDIKKSAIGSRLVVSAEHYGGTIKSSLNSITREALKFVTVKPQSQERIDLDVAPEEDDLHDDAASEARMVELVNDERVKVGVGVLTAEVALTRIARLHSRDMFVRRYFAHVSPDGGDVAKRARDEGVSFMLIGENLAYAPDGETAHAGLMESQAHRRNILDPAFTRVGVGVIDTDVYGKMFTQVFAN